MNPSHSKQATSSSDGAMGLVLLFPREIPVELSMARFSGGWVKLWRSIWDHPIGKDAGLFHLFSWLISNANVQQTQALLHGKLVVVPRGALVTSTPQLADALGVARSTVFRRLRLLETLDTIRHTSGAEGTVITIINYEEYQLNHKDSAIVAEHRVAHERNTSGTRAEHERAPIEEEKKERREELRLESESHDSRRPSPRQLANLWNEKKAPDQPKINVASLKPPSKRWVWAQSRLVENPDLAYWAGIIERIAKSSFCNGSNDRGWKADFEFLVRVDTHVKVLEGKYDDRDSATNPNYWDGFEELVKQTEPRR